MSKKDRAAHIVQKLHEANFEAYWVGGCVRDTLLGRIPKDYDIVTDASPDDIKLLFPEHHAAGAVFGVIVVHYPEATYDVATYRTESGYSDRRRPDHVAWATSQQDVTRRDFTVNGLLYNPETEQVVDYVDGQRDLKLKLIRFIGDPAQRVEEDPVRMLRALRLKHELNFQLDKPSFDAIAQHAELIRHVSGERIRQELNRLLLTPTRAEGLHDLDQTGLLAIILPELEALKGTPQPQEYHQEGDVFDHTLRAVTSLGDHVPVFLVWAVLLHDVGKPETLAYADEHRMPRITTYHHAEHSAALAERIFRRLRFSRNEIETMTWMIAHHMSLLRIEEMRPARREAYVLDPRFPWLLELHRADAAGTIPRDLSLYAHDLKLYERMKAEHERQKHTQPPLLLDGHGLQRALKLEPGPKIGKLLEEIRNAQLHGQIQTKQEAIGLAKRLIQ